MTVVSKDTFDCDVQRVYGSNRYGTSIEIANNLKEAMGVSKFDNIVVVSGMDFPDGLCGGPLAAYLKAPVILTQDGNTKDAAAYMTEAEIKKGLVTGGSSALTDDTVRAAFNMTSSAVIK